jgi:glycosyltransferase involved in cell wall biosynthesis
MSCFGLTIGIPNWNHELVLARSVSSALEAIAELRGQGVSGEVLVVDDHSRDGSVTLLRQLEALYYDDGLRVLALCANRGLPAARNLALQHAHYRYLLYLDADNTLIPANVPYFLRSIKETGAAAVFGNLLARYHTKEVAHYVLSNEPVQKKLFQSNYIDALSMFDRIQLLDCGAYDASCPAVEDYEQWLHLATNGRKIVFIPMVLGYYYFMPSSMLSQSNPQVNNRVQRIFNQLDIRRDVPVNTDCLRYHPSTGYL